MSPDITDLFDKEICITRKRPFYFYLTLSLWTILFILFLTVSYIQQLDKDNIFLAAVIVLFFAIYIYVLFGRYLARISLYDHYIQIQYLFPWNKKLAFRFDKLTEIEFKEFELVDRLTRGWYRGGKWLYLKNEAGEACQFKYTINTSDNKDLLAGLQKRCSSDIVYS